MNYKIVFDRGRLCWEVVNTKTNERQSTWYSFAPANEVAFDLNKKERENERKVAHIKRITNSDRRGLE